MKESGEILYLFESSHLDDLLTHYGLQLKTSMLKTVAEHVCRKVRQSGQPVKVSFGYHYDAGTCSMYVSVDPLRVLRMTASQVEYVDNVVDGLLNLPAGEPIAVDLESIRTSKLGLMVQSGSLMYDDFDATYADETICAEFNHQLVCTRILALFFTDLFTSRSLLILDGAEGRVARIKDGQYVPDTNIRGEALKMRNAVMTEDLGRSRNILIALKAQAEYNPPHILRLHDFAGFVLRCAVHEHWVPAALEMLRAVASAQHEEANANNPMYDVIRQYIGGFPKACKDRLSATALGKRFKEAAEELSLDAKLEWGPYGMRGVLNKQYSSLRTQFGLCREKNPRSNSRVFWFEPSRDQLEACSEFAKQSLPYRYEAAALNMASL